MDIEEPENPVPVRERAEAMAAVEFATIGEFYDAIKEQIQKLGPSIFVQTSAPPQVVNTNWFSADRLFTITGVDAACRAIDLIKLEGEGTSVSPFEGPGDPAHYYKFGEIVAGRELVQTETGFAYAGTPVPFDPAGVWPLRPNCKIADFKQGTQARTRIEAFAYNYSALLNSVHNTFNGGAARLGGAVGVMYGLRVIALAALETGPDDRSGQTVG